MIAQRITRSAIELSEIDKPGRATVDPHRTRRQAIWRTAVAGLILGSIASAVFLFALVRSADAFALGLAGIDGAALLRDQASTLYASDRDGRVIALARVGAPLGNEVVTDLGIPQMMPEGRVLFAAQTESASGVEAWRIYVGDPNLPLQDRVKLGLKPGLGTANCTPVFKVDPYPVVGPDGEIAVVAPEASGGDALFLYRNGQWSCLTHTGDRTEQGHVIAVLGFGSQQAGRRGEVVIRAWLRPSQQPRRVVDDAPALLLASAGAAARELASSIDQPKQISWCYRAFGLPAALAVRHDTVVAFVANTSTEKSLFLYRNGRVTRVLSTSALTLMGPVSYLSLGRPGLMADGTTAVLAGVGGTPTLLQVARGHLRIRARRPIPAPSGDLLQWFGDPALTGSGAMFFGGQNPNGSDRVYVMGQDGRLFEAGSSNALYEIDDKSHSGHSAFSGSLSVNQRGDFTYLGGN